MDEIIKSQEKTNGESASEVQSLSEMPSFEKHMAEIESGVENDEKAGEIDEPKNSFGVEALISEPDGNKESKGFLEFEKKHPELAAEMRELDIPLNEKEFAEQGYSFYSSSIAKDKSGSPVVHLRRETTEFRDWKKEHPDEEPPREIRKFAPIDKSGISDALFQEGGDYRVIGPAIRHERELLEQQPSVIEKRRLREEAERLEWERKEAEWRQQEAEEQAEIMRWEEERRQKEKEERLEKVKREQMEAEEKFESLNEDELDEFKEKMYQRLQNDLFFGHGNHWINTTKQVIDENGKIGENAFDGLLVESDRDAVRNFLLDTIATGAKDTYDWNGFGYQKKTGYFIPDKYYTNRLDKALENYEVDTDGEGEYKRALVGFANTLSGVNGEKTDQAQWYFEKFKFAENWDRFLGAMAVTGEKRGIGFKRKLTMFLKTRIEWGERNDSIKAEKEARKLASKNDFARLGNMREVSKDYIDTYVEALREDANLDDDYFPVKDVLSKLNDESASGEAAGSKVSTANGEAINNKPNNLRNNDSEYGKMKIVKLGDWCDYIQKNVDSDAKFYIESIGAGDKRIRGEYIAVQFTMGDKTYCIAESIKDNAAMYLASGEAGEDIREYFRTLSKREARKDDHINVIYHLDKDNFGDSLDQCYAKAFFLLFGGKKSQKDFGKTQVFPVGA